MLTTKRAKSILSMRREDAIFCAKLRENCTQDKLVEAKASVKNGRV